jgi:hypothetical protein
MLLGTYRMPLGTYMILLGMKSSYSTKNLAIEDDIIINCFTYQLHYFYMKIYVCMLDIDI